MKQSVEDNSRSIGGTPLVRLNRVVAGCKATVLAKIEGRNPAYSVKCRIGASMIWDAEEKGILKPGVQVIEPTSGNTGIALAMAAAVKGDRLKLIMPSNQSEERKGAMRAYGAELIDVSPEEGMEGARDLALRMQLIVHHHTYLLMESKETIEVVVVMITLIGLLIMLSETRLLTAFMVALLLIII